jgi:hypothetical protein
VIVVSADDLRDDAAMAGLVARVEKSLGGVAVR